MRISVTGWGRNMGERQLMECALNKLDQGDENGRVYKNKPPVIYKDYFGKLSLAWHQNLSHMGDYRMEMNFSKADVLQLFKSMFGTELNTDLLERHGFSVSEDLKKTVLRSVKLSDVTLGDLAAMNSTESGQETATAEKLIEAPSNVKPFVRRI